MRVSRLAGQAHNRCLRRAQHSWSTTQRKREFSDSRRVRNLLRPPPGLYHSQELPWLLEPLAVDVGLVCLPVSQVPARGRGAALSVRRCRRPFSLQSANSLSTVACALTSLGQICRKSTSCPLAVTTVVW